MLVLRIFVSSFLFYIALNVPVDS